MYFPAGEFPACISMFPDMHCIPARFKSSPVNAIYCQALAGSPLRPQRLTQLDKEQEEQLKPPFSSASETREVRHGQKGDKEGGGFMLTEDTWLRSIFDTLQEEASPVREEAFTSTHKPITVGGQSQVTVGTTHISRLTDEQLIKEFLSGSYCLHGVRHARLQHLRSLINYSVTYHHLNVSCREWAGGNMNSVTESMSINTMR